MPRLIVTKGAVRGLDRCRRFLLKRSGAAASAAASVISSHFAMLESNPTIGRPVAGDEALRELVIRFGHTGYVALYRCELDEDAVYILAFRHQKEAGY